MHQQIGMENILTNVAPHLGVVGGAPLLRPTPELAARWGALDDGACARACTPLACAGLAGLQGEGPRWRGRPLTIIVHAPHARSCDGRRQRERAAAGARRWRGRQRRARVQVRMRRASKRKRKRRQPWGSQGLGLSDPPLQRLQGRRLNRQPWRLCECALPQLGAGARPGRLRWPAPAPEGQRPEVRPGDHSRGAVRARAARTLLFVPQTCPTRGADA